jgi:hypothetical protein
MSKLSRFLGKYALAARKWIWQLTHTDDRGARALFIIGVQRSGTTMLKDCLDKSLEMEIYGEKSKAMQDFRIKDDTEISKMIRNSRARIIGFKPLTDSHRAHELLAVAPDSLAIWMYRKPADRANSAVSRFGTTNLDVLTDIAAGKQLDSWQALGLSEKNLALLRTFDYARMTPHSAAGLFWYIRNSLYFEQNLEACDRVLPLAYEDLVGDARRIMRGLCRFLDCTFSDAMVKGIHEQSVGRSESRLSPEIASLCNPVYQRLYEIQQRKWRTLNLDD